MFATAMLLVTLAGHYPTLETADSCRAPFVPCTDIAALHVFQQIRHQQPRLYLVLGCGGLEGQPFSFQVPDSQAVYWCEVADSAGNRRPLGSCGGPNLVQVGGAVSVPPAAPRAAGDFPRWFDVMGRRMEPRRPGWYGRRGRDTVVVR